MPAPLTRSFQTTRWSLVRLAANGVPSDTGSRQAMAALCEAYWYPIYAYIRRGGRSPEDAEDLTQSFFGRLIEKGLLHSADPNRGKLRTYLLACVHNFLINEDQKTRAAKRGAERLLSIDVDWAESRYLAEPADHLTPDRLYQRRWALAVLEHTFKLLEMEQAKLGKQTHFDELRGFLGFGGSAAESYETAAARTGITPGTLRVQVSRLRARWRELLFEQVAMTLGDPDSENIKAELAELLACL